MACEPELSRWSETRLRASAAIPRLRHEHRRCGPGWRGLNPLLSCCAKSIISGTQSEFESLTPNQLPLVRFRGTALRPSKVEPYTSTNFYGPKYWALPPGTWADLLLINKVNLVYFGNSETHPCPASATSHDDV